MPKLYQNTADRIAIMPFFISGTRIFCVKYILIVLQTRTDVGTCDMNNLKKVQDENLHEILIGDLVTTNFCTYVGTWFLTIEKNFFVFKLTTEPIT